MNCAETQDLLLDLAYGELEPARAAEVEAHVAECATCRAERAHLERTRHMAAPLRNLEEPAANFDEPILRAARAEAGMQADGTPGPVVEVAASVKPLGLQAARLDPHARVRGDVRQAPWWRRRAAVIGSTAAAAALAVVVSVSVTRQQQANRVEHEVAPITIRAPQLVIPQTLDDALAKREQRGTEEAPAPGSRAVLQQPPAAPPAQKDTAPKKLARAAPPQDSAAGAKDSQNARRKEAQRTDDGEAKLAERAAAAKQPPATVVATSSPPPAAATTASPPPAPAGAAAAPPAAPDRARARVAAAERNGSTSAAENAVRPLADARLPAHTPEAPSPATSGGIVGGVLDAPAQRKPEPPGKTADQVEDDASAARRAGDYARAAALYKQAAALRSQAAPPRAAWDMAHAVECLAAGGNVPEAIEARKELLRRFPDQQGPRAAADSALRTVPLPPDQSTVPPK